MYGNNSDRDLSLVNLCNIILIFIISNSIICTNIKDHSKEQLFLGIKWQRIIQMGVCVEVVVVDKL